MKFDPKIMRAVEQLSYRVTVGDVAAHAGLEINLAQQGLLTLASETNGHLQVSEMGDIAYIFPRNLRAILRNKSLRLRLQEWWSKIWQVLFYLIRISFGIFLVLSIILIFVTIVLITMSSSRGGNSNSRRRGGGIPLFLPHFWFGSFFNPNPHGHARNRSVRQKHQREPAAEQLNFFEAVFSFLFGDGNPNANLEERRRYDISTVIYNHGGAVVAEQIAPYLDISETQAIDEAYILPILMRFDGRPEVSPTGDIIYRFPALQTTAIAKQEKAVDAYLRELFWNFSRVGTEQTLLVVGLGFLNLIGALVLRYLLSDGAIAVQLGGLVAFVQSIFWVLLGYGIGFLGIPLIRYFWIQGRNRQIERRNQKRQEYAAALNQADANLQRKIEFAQEFATQSVVSQDDLAYTSEKDLLEQEIKSLDGNDNDGRRLLS